MGFRSFTTVGELFLVLLFSSLWVTHLSGGFDFIMVVSYLPSHCGFFFVFGHCVSFFFCLLFFGRFKHLPVDCYSTASCDFDAHAAEDECTSYSTFLNQKLSPFFKLKIITVKLICLHLIWPCCLHQWCIKSIDCPYNFFLKLLCYNPVIIVLVWLFQRPLSTTKSQS